MFACSFLNLQACQSGLYAFKRPRLFLESRSTPQHPPWPHQIWKFQLRKWYRVLEILRSNILTSCDTLLTRQGNFLSILFFSVVSLVHGLANKVVVCPHCQINYLVLVQVIIKQHTLTTANRLSFHFRYEVLNKGRAWLKLLLTVT